MAERTFRLYAYATPRTEDPHAVQIELARDDAARYARSTGEWVRVVDRDTGREFDVCRVPCGLRCRCAAQAKAVVA